MFADLQTLPEDDRIRAIGEAAMRADHADRGDGKKAGTVAFVVDRREESGDGGEGPEGAKLARCVRKLLARFPSVAVLETGAGPTAATQFAIVKRRADAPRWPG